MNTAPPAIDLRAETKDFDAAMKKLSTIRDILPVTVANFIAGVGGTLGLVDVSVGDPIIFSGVVSVAPSDRLAAFLAVFSDEDLAEPAPDAAQRAVEAFEALFELPAPRRFKQALFDDFHKIVMDVLEEQSRPGGVLHPMS